MNRALAAGTGVFVALAIALAATYGAPNIERTPIRPDGVWRWVFIAAVAACFVAFVTGICLLRRARARLAPVLAIAFAIQLAPLATPLLMSTDVYGYWEYGWIGAVADANPYAHLPREFLENPAHELRGEAWTDWPLYYGPLFVAASEGIALVADARWEVVWTYKSLAALAMLVVVSLTAVLAPRRAYAVAFVGWNPLLALHFAGGGHNDAWMMALFLGALALWRRGHRELAAPLWLWAIAIKWVPLLWLPLDALAQRRRPPRVPWLGLTLGLAALAALSTWRFGLSWIGAFLPIRQQVDLTSSTSVPFLVATLTDTPAVWVGRAFFALFVAAYAWLLLEAWRGRARRGLAAGLLLVAVAWLGPWYALWCIPLAAIDDDPPAEILAVVLSAFLLRDALPIPYVV